MVDGLLHLLRFGVDEGQPLAIWLVQMDLVAHVQTSEDMIVQCVSLVGELNGTHQCAFLHMLSLTSTSSFQFIQQSFEASLECRESLGCIILPP